jgi:hypothetical protein
MKIWLNFDYSKTSNKFWLWYLKDDFHIKFYYDAIPYIESLIWNEIHMNLFIFYHSSLLTSPYSCILKIHCEKWVYFYWKKLYKYFHNQVFNV